LAKATLLEPTLQAGGSFTTLEGILLEVGVETEISTHNAMIYMKSKNIKIEFEDNDFKNMPEAVLENMSKKLKIDVKDVKTAVLPKKTVTAKVTKTLKSTLSSKPKPKLVEKEVEEIPLVDENPTEEVVSND